MARIKGWGELNCSTTNKRFKELCDFDGEFGVEMNIRLDDPIEIPAEARVEGLYPLWCIESESNVDINDGDVRRNDVFSNLVPEEIVKVLAKQKAYRSITLYLDNSSRDWKDNSPAPLCDLGISIGLKEKVVNSDRFLQSFARKLNKWLSIGRIKWEWMSNPPDSECGANYIAGIHCLDNCEDGGEHDFPNDHDPKLCERQPNEFLGFIPDHKDLKAGITCKKCGRIMEVPS